MLIIIYILITQSSEIKWGRIYGREGDDYVKAVLECAVKGFIPSLFKNKLNIFYGWSKNYHSSIKIYDVSGRLVKKFNNLTIQSFAHIVWDGTNALASECTQKKIYL